MRKIALCGFAGTTRRTDWPEDTEVWTINCAWRYGFERIDRLFEMHPIEQLTADLERPTLWEGDHWKWLQQVGDFPIFMMAHDDRIPDSVAYPLEEVCADIFSHLFRGEVMNRYLTSSLSFMLALAIHEGCDEIYLAGFEMASGTEYTYQRDGGAYLLGVANGRGIDVILPEKSAFMRAKLYSYQGGQMVDKTTILRHQEGYERQYEELSHITPTPYDLFRAEGAFIALRELYAHTDLPFIGRQGLEKLLGRYGQQHSEAMGYCNKFGPESFGRILMLCEGAIQAFENLIDVCDLQEPNLKIHEIAHFIELKQEKPTESELEMTEV